MTQTADVDRDARRTLDLLGPAPDNWVPDRPGVDHNVFIVGAGQTGCAFAFALRRAGIGRVSVIDAAADATQAGVWLNRARMNKLRTPKTLVGPEGGLPGLSFRAWYEARFGAASYQEIDRIPRERWAEYLAWYREFLEIPVRYGARLLRVEPKGTHFALHLEVDGVARVETARKLLLCNGVAGNGVAGNGGAFVPAVLKSLPPQLVAHTSDPIDFAALRGKSVAVLGGAASAFDAAATALEAGAADVHLFARRTTLAATPVSRARAYPGAYDNYFDLPDALRWAQALRFKRSGSTAPPDSIERVTRFENFHLHLGTEWESAREASGQIAAVVSGETFASTSPLREPAISSILPRVPNWPASRRTSCCGATSSRRLAKRRTTG